MGRFFFFFPLVKAPGCVSQKTPGIKVGVPEMVLGGGKQVWFRPTCGFPAFVHSMLIWAVGVSLVRGFRNPEPGTCLGGAKERQIWGDS